MPEIIFKQTAEETKFTGFKYPIRAKRDVDRTTFEPKIKFEAYYQMHDGVHRWWQLSTDWTLELPVANLSMNEELAIRDELIKNIVEELKNLKTRDRWITNKWNETVNRIGFDSMLVSHLENMEKFDDSSINDKVEIVITSLQKRIQYRMEHPLVGT